jgi:hypothetical protein
MSTTMKTEHGNGLILTTRTSHVTVYSRVIENFPYSFKVKGSCFTQLQRTALRANEKETVWGEEKIKYR